MEKDKAIMLLTSALVLVGVVHYNTAYQVGLSPGEGNLFASYGFYVGLFVVWSGLTVFIIAKNRKQSSEIKEKREVKLGKRVDSKEIERKIEKKVSKKLERKLNKKVSKKVSVEINKKLKR
tara:strand:+ start:4364 stop:4726 length:363 start_codon:yes stop_codon:yes gene_type:complete